MGRRNQLVNRCSRHRPSEDETLQSSRIPAEPVDKRTVNLYGVDRKTLQPVPKSSITNATPKLFSRCRVSSKWFTSFMNKLSVNSKQSPSGGADALKDVGDEANDIGSNHLTHRKIHSN